MDCAFDVQCNAISCGVPPPRPHARPGRLPPPSAGGLPPPRPLAVLGGSAPQTPQRRIRRTSGIRTGCNPHRTHGNVWNCSWIKNDLISIAPAAQHLPHPPAGGRGCGGRETRSKPVEMKSDAPQDRLAVLGSGPSFAGRGEGFLGSCRVSTSMSSGLPRVWRRRPQVNSRVWRGRGRVCRILETRLRGPL